MDATPIATWNWAPLKCLIGPESPFGHGREPLIDSRIPERKPQESGEWIMDVITSVGLGLPKFPVDRRPPVLGDVVTIRHARRRGEEFAVGTERESVHRAGASAENRRVAFRPRLLESQRPVVGAARNDSAVTSRTSTSAPHRLRPSPATARETAGRIKLVQLPGAVVGIDRGHFAFRIEHYGRVANSITRSGTSPTRPRRPRRPRRRSRLHSPRHRRASSVARTDVRHRRRDL